MKHKRKPGGQPGNQNARTHGFYSNVLTPEQRASVRGMQHLVGLDQEIAVARLKIKSILTHAPRNYRVLIEAMSLLGRLVAVNKKLGWYNSRQFLQTVAYALHEMSPDKGGDVARRDGVVSPSFLENE